MHREDDRTHTYKGCAFNHLFSCRAPVEALLLVLAGQQRVANIYICCIAIFLLEQSTYNTSTYNRESEMRETNSRREKKKEEKILKEKQRIKKQAKIML